MKKTFCLLPFLVMLLAVVACSGPGRGSGQAPKNASSGYDDIPRPRFSTPVTHEELRAAYYRYSAIAVVNALAENDYANYDYIFDQVASGDGDWIRDFVSYVAPGADAATGEGVGIALAHALPNNPKAVLQLDEDSMGPSLRRICTLPFIEPEYEFIKDYGERTLAALQKVDDPYLLEARDLCIKRLKKSLANCEKIYKEGKWTY